MAMATIAAEPATASTTRKPLCEGKVTGPSLMVSWASTTPETALATEVPIDRIRVLRLLAAAVSPGYDLRLALRATRRQIVSFYSPLDQLILNLGTRHFGTIDRHYGPSAGLKGFDVPKGLDDHERLLYERLVQIP